MTFKSQATESHATESRATSRARVAASSVGSRAFTIIELLVVISIFVLVLAIAVPSFSAILYSTERSQAGNQVSVALGAARSAAVGSEGLNDTAAVFFYDPSTGRTRIGVYAVAGQIKDNDLRAAPNNVVERDVFVPVPNFQPVQLPKGWMVRGFAPSGSVDVAGTGIASRNFSGWYEANTSRIQDGNTGNWVFPETGFYNPEKATDVVTGGETARQSFMVRFVAGSGAVSMSERTPAIVVDPSPSQAFRQVAPYQNYRLDRAQDLGSEVRRILAENEPNNTDTNPIRTRKRQLLGDAASDTVLARPVLELAVYDERTLGSALKARGLNAVTGTIYSDEFGTKLVGPEIDQKIFPVSFTAAEIAKNINNWIQGTVSNGKTASASTVASDARIVTMDRYTGTVREILP